MRSRSALGALVCVLMFMTVACSKNDSPTVESPSTSLASQSPSAAEASPPPSPSPPSESDGSDLAGTWQGSWQSVKPDQSSGSFVLHWTQSGSSLTGSITINGTPCLNGGNISGEVNGDQITFGVVAGQVNVSYTGTLKGQDTISGSYSTDCGNASGDWTATRKA